MWYPLLSAGAMNSLFFGVYGVSLRAITSSSDPICGSLTADGKPSYYQIWLAGCVGGAAQLTIAVPVDVVKIKLQTQTGML